MDRINRMIYGKSIGKVSIYLVDPVYPVSF